MPVCNIRRISVRRTYMNIAITILLFVVGVLFVVKGGDIFVDAASWIAKASGIPSFIVGATIVSIATTLPEMLVSVMAATEGKTEMAVGNAVGSVIANTGLILAVAIMFMNIICKRKDYMLQCLLLAASAIVLWLSCAGGKLSGWGSIMLVIIFLIFMFLNVKEAKEDMQNDNDSEKVFITKKDLAVNIVKFLLGAALIVEGSQLLVSSGSEIATFLGVPERIIAVTLVAIGTSLPELVTTITAISKKESSLSIGNLIGANIIDLALILPMCSFVSGTQLPVSSQSLTVDIPVCIALILLAVIPMIIKEKATKKQGLMIIVGYAVYLFAVI